MEPANILHNLNENQHQAVAAPLCNQLILAGAGSGKTRVLVHRIAWLIQKENLYPSAILAVTFTNKAAKEMQFRIEKLLGIPTRSMWVGTFHALAHRLLRLHWRDAKLPETFQVMDTQDQLRLVKRIIRQLNLDENQWSATQAQWFINGQKDAGIRPEKVEAQSDLYLKTQVQIYAAYEEACNLAGLVDFAELLLRAYELWLHNPELLQHYRARFKHVLVDEFQDTNTIQYAWIKLLIDSNNSVTLVGDDDQSIYGWRGARIENIHQAQRDFNAIQIVRLEQNYRSTNAILGAADALIKHNCNRMGKTLWSAGEFGETISVYQAFNDLDEARYIGNIVAQWIDQGNRRDSIVILYRSNAQSRVLEETFIEAKIPYRIYGGLRFYERAEIKDALAYLRVMTNHDDATAFERIINTPARGIGASTLDILREYARQQQVSLWHAAEELLNHDTLTSRAKNALSRFLDLIVLMAQDTQEMPLDLQMRHVLQESGLLDYYRREKGEQGQTRLENLDELITAIRQFVPETDEIPVEQAFLAHVALESGDTQSQGFEDCVQMMTLHSVKGLEFPLVIMSGMEEGLFPHQMSMQDPNRLEEERRLCYVGITRAMQKLYFTYAECRRMHGAEQYHRASRFLKEIPKKYLSEVRLKSHVSGSMNFAGIPKKTRAFESQINSGLKIGSTVHHKKFGAGIILDCEGSGDHARVQVKFPQEGIKWLIASFLQYA